MYISMYKVYKKGTLEGAEQIVIYHRLSVSRLRQVRLLCFLFRFFVFKSIVVVRKRALSRVVVKSQIS